MKHLFYLPLIIGLISFTGVLYGQDREDVIYLSDGQQKKGKVLSISDEGIKFSYTGETVVYDLMKTKINKIIFSNGREEIFKSDNANNQIVSKDGTVLAGNLMAVLPFEIVSNDPSIINDGMRKKIQESCLEAFRSQGLIIQLQDERTTNSKLADAGINLSEIGNHTPEELSHLLKVEYIVLGTYDIENRGVSTFGSGLTSYDGKIKENKEKGTTVTSTNSYSTTIYNTKVHLSIYDLNGRQLFSDTRSPAFGGLDSYRGALKTLSKRVPLKK